MQRAQEKENKAEYVELHAIARHDAEATTTAIASSKAEDALAATGTIASACATDTGLQENIATTAFATDESVTTSTAASIAAHEIAEGTFNIARTDNSDKVNAVKGNLNVNQSEASRQTRKDHLLLKPVKSDENKCYSAEEFPL